MPKHHAMLTSLAYLSTIPWRCNWGSGGKSPHILNFGTICR